MGRRRTPSFALLVLLFAAHVVAADDHLAVIVPPAQTAQLTVADIAQIYLRKRRYWTTGEAIMPVNREADCPVRTRFTRAVFGGEARWLATAAGDPRLGRGGQAVRRLGPERHRLHRRPRRGRFGAGGAHSPHAVTPIGEHEWTADATGRRRPPPHRGNPIPVAASLVAPCRFRHGVADCSTMPSAAGDHLGDRDPRSI